MRSAVSQTSEGFMTSNAQNFFCVDKTLGVNWSVESTALNMSQHEEIAGDLLRPELLLAGQAETVIKEVSITKRRGTKKNK